MLVACVRVGVCGCVRVRVRVLLWASASARRCGRGVWAHRRVGVWACRCVVVRASFFLGGRTYFRKFLVFRSY